MSLGYLSCYNELKSIYDELTNDKDGLKKRAKERLLTGVDPLIGKPYLLNIRQCNSVIKCDFDKSKFDNSFIEFTRYSVVLNCKPSMRGPQYVSNLRFSPKHTDFREKMSDFSSYYSFSLPEFLGKCKKYVGNVNGIDIYFYPMDVLGKCELIGVENNDIVFSLSIVSINGIKVKYNGFKEKEDYFSIEVSVRKKPFVLVFSKKDFAYRQSLSTTYDDVKDFILARKCV